MINFGWPTPRFALRKIAASRPRCDDRVRRRAPRAALALEVRRHFRRRGDHRRRAAHVNGRRPPAREHGRDWRRGGGRRDLRAALFDSRRSSDGELRLESNAAGDDDSDGELLLEENDGAPTGTPAPAPAAPAREEDAAALRDAERLLRPLAQFDLPELKRRLLRLRADGDRHFAQAVRERRGELQRALALEAPNARANAALWYNRAACHQHLGQPRLAHRDALLAARPSRRTRARGGAPRARDRRRRPRRRRRRRARRARGRAGVRRAARLERGCRSFQIDGVTISEVTPTRPHPAVTPHALMVRHAVSKSESTRCHRHPCSPRSSRPARRSGSICSGTRGTRSGARAAEPLRRSRETRNPPSSSPPPNPPSITKPNPRRSTIAIANAFGAIAQPARLG